MKVLDFKTPLAEPITDIHIVYINACLFEESHVNGEIIATFDGNLSHYMHCLQNIVIYFKPSAIRDMCISVILCSCEKETDE